MNTGSLGSRDDKQYPSFSKKAQVLNLWLVSSDLPDNFNQPQNQKAQIIQKLWQLEAVVKIESWDLLVLLQP